MRVNLAEFAAYACNAWKFFAEGEGLSLPQKRMNVFVYTLGCRVNQCESEGIIQSFLTENWRLVRNYYDADLIIVNTCTVTSKAEQKARRMIRLFASVCTTLITGCYTDESLERISEKIILIPIFLKVKLLSLPAYLNNNSLPDSKPGDAYLRNLIKGYFSLTPGEDERRDAAFAYNVADFSLHCRSYLKIQDGCDNACAYCRTRIARGKSVFLEEEEVVRRALELEKSGYHEIVLTGINLTMYNHRAGGLGSLLEKLLTGLGSDIRLRLSSMEADNVDDRFIACLKDKRMQPYFHIPVQSGSDRVLQRVNRHCSTAEIAELVEKIALIRDNPLFACDVITGLPSEEDSDFKLTIDFLNRYNFNLFHVFPFSPRPDTPLYKAKDRVSEAVRDERASVLRALSERRYADYVKSWIGRENEAIIEETCFASADTAADTVADAKADAGANTDSDANAAANEASNAETNTSANEAANADSYIYANTNADSGKGTHLRTGFALTGNYIRAKVVNLSENTVIGALKKVILTSADECRVID